MGLDVYLYRGEEDINLPSTSYPEHYFKIGYWRSSYNATGINNVMSQVGLATLYDLVEPPGDEHEIRPDWRACLKRTKKAILDLEAFCQKPLAQYSVTDIGHDPFSRAEVFSDSQALNVFGEQLSRQPGNGSYSNKQGTFCLEGLNCLGFVPGFDALQQPCVYVVYKTEPDRWLWYHQALEIVQETLEFVLANPSPDYLLHWSS